MAGVTNAAFAAVEIKEKGFEGEEMKDRFLFFENFRRIADSLPDDLQLNFYKSLMAYVFDDEEPQDPIIKSLIIAISPSLDKEDGRANNGGKRENAGRKTKNIEDFESIEKIENEKSNLINSNQSFSNNNQSFQFLYETETRNGNKKQEDIIPPSEDRSSSVGIEEAREKIAPLPPKKFLKPTVDEVRAYCLERKNDIDPEKWFDFYQSKGWRVGSQPMKDWKAAVRTWERRNDYQTLPKKQNDDDDFYRQLEALQ